MGDDAETEQPLSEEDAQKRQLRLLGYGVILSGFVTLLVAYVSTQPHGILLFGLGGVAVATLVFEKTQGARVGLSLGFLTASIGVWLWPHLEPDGSYYLLGLMLIAIGGLNVLLTPLSLYFRRLGERLAER